MIKKGFNVFVTFFLASLNLSAQTLSTSVLPTGGGSASSGGVQLNWTLGQSVMPTTLVEGSGIITQGFQQPELQVWTGAVNNRLYKGVPVHIPFKASGIVSDRNVYMAELSDKNGNFTNPVIIGMARGSENGAVTGTIPASAEPGFQYRIRIRSSASPFKGVDNGFPLTIKQKLLVQVSPNPSTAYFTLATNGGSGEPLEIKTVDFMGRVVETRKGLPAGGFLRIGSNYRPGIYVVEITQGSDKVVLQLNKQPD